MLCASVELRIREVLLSLAIESMKLAENTACILLPGGWHIAGLYAAIWLLTHPSDNHCQRSGRGESHDCQGMGASPSTVGGGSKGGALQHLP